MKQKVREHNQQNDAILPLKKHTEILSIISCLFQSRKGDTIGK